MSTKLAIVNTHPIQYYAPLFRRLSDFEELDIKVFYGWKGSTEVSYDHGFEKDLEWDIPLLEGYSATFVPNKSSDPGTHHFRGIVNPAMTSAIETWGAEAVLVYGWAWQTHLRTLLYFHNRIPVFFRGDSTLIDERSGIQRVLRRISLWWVYRYVDHALYVGTRNRAYFEQHGLGDEQLHWVPHAVENRRFSDPDGSSQEEAITWRRELGIPSEAPTVVFAGKLSRKKGVDLLLEAFGNLSHSGAHVVVAGSGPLEDKVRREADAKERVHFVGFQNQSRMPVVYRLGNVFVLPSRGPGETWGLAVNEAMACGRAVVVSDKVGCAPDLVDDSNGRVVPAKDARALEDALDRLIERPERLSRMGKRSRKRVKQWSIEEAASRTADSVRTAVS